MSEVVFKIHFSSSKVKEIKSKLSDLISNLKEKVLECSGEKSDPSDIKLFLEKVGQIDDENLINLPLDTFISEPTTKFDLFVLNLKHPENFAEIYCSQNILPFSKLKQVGFKHSKYNYPICKACSIFCRSDQGFTNKIVSEEFICKCPLLGDNGCKFTLCQLLNKEMQFKFLNNLTKIQALELNKTEIEKENEQNKKILLREFEFTYLIPLMQSRLSYYNNEKLKADILAIIPKKEQNQTHPEYIKVLLKWFKTDFFSWCNSPKCKKCEDKPETKTIFFSSRNPLEEEKSAYRVELYKCNNCGNEVPFVRYNDPYYLYCSKTGRCSEYSNLFACILHYVGYNIRLINNFEDHVWDEYYSEEEKRWIHLDPCEAAYDTPLLYEKGWGRVMTFVIAVGFDGVFDVTPRYVSSRDACLRRRNPREVDKLKFLLKQWNPENKDEKFLERKKLEEEELKKLWNGIERVTGEDESKGRTSGSLEWRKNRGEL